VTIVSSVPPVHPEHDAVSREVHRWYNSAVPEIGLDGTAHWFGFVTGTGPAEARAVLSISDPALVTAAIADLRATCPGSRCTVMVDDRERSARLDAALRYNGCRYQESTTYLALTGPLVSPAPGPAGLQVAIAGATELAKWAEVKVRSFADSESTPAAGAVSAETETRRAELPLAECQFGLLDGEPVAVLAHYPGPDSLVFNLGTRVPFRHRGIAQAMLTRWVAGSPGARSLMINATDGGAPAALYRRLGFTDEVYWYSKYELTC
jgi:ribosomal protein S18 acetylase RimI-like enzyme